MKYFVLIPDGMADEKIDVLGNKTPMEAAYKPVTDALASRSHIGTVLNVPEGMVPESDTANMAVMSFDPSVYSRGRSPLEAVSMGLTLGDRDVAIRCNTVSLSDGDSYAERVMLDHSADEIPTEESDIIIRALNDKFSNDIRHFYTGVSYRHCLVWRDADDKYPFMRPHDIIGRRIGDYLPDSERGREYLELMRASNDLMENLPINISRRERGLKPANSIWLWSPGKKPTLPSFYNKFGLKATVVSAVDLIKGIGICAGMSVVDVPGATGNIHTNFKGKAEAAIHAFESGSDLVYLHVEAPDECGHRAEIENKVHSIELIDANVLSPVLSYLDHCGDDFGIMILPDHPTPLRLRTHTSDPVPYMIYSSAHPVVGISSFTEENASHAGSYIPDGSGLMQLFINTCK